MELNPINSLMVIPSAAELQQLTNYDIVNSVELELSIVFMIFRIIPRTSNNPILSNQPKITSQPISWGYVGTDGPGNWKNYKSTCGGQSQSPIDIRPSLVLVNGQGKIDFINYDFPTLVEVTNNGHTVNVEILDNVMGISGAGLDGPYQVAQFHFHWGANDGMGSEHTINGHAFPLEMHVVHFKQSYGTLTDAAIQPDGIAVLSSLFEFKKKDSRYVVFKMKAQNYGVIQGVSVVDNPVFTSLLNTFENIQNPNEKLTFTLMSLRSLLPAFNNYYRYQGSLTTPPCSESVIWTIATELVRISPTQMQQFRRLMSSEKDSNGGNIMLVNNFRPVQNINGRKITANTAV